MALVAVVAIALVSTPLVAVIKPASLVTTILTRGLSVVLALLLAFLIATIA